MLRRIRSFVLISIAAIAGAVCGRAFAQMREQGESPLAGRGVRPSGLRIRPQDVVPGIVAAFRIGEAPWSWLHIPGWLAAFAVNFGAAALGGDIQRLRDMFERGGITLDDPWHEDDAGEVLHGEAVATWDVEEAPGSAI